MSKVVHRHPNIAKVRKQIFEFKLTCFLVPFFILSCLFIVLNACTLKSQTNTQLTTSDNIPVEENKTTDIALTPETPLEVNTLVPTRFIEIPTPHLISDTVATAPPPLDSGVISLTITPTPKPETPPINGQLFIYNPSGIQQVTLASDAQEYLLTIEDDWFDWGASFAQNNKYLAYWIKNSNGTELWGTSLSQWQPELLLKLDDVEYDFATPLWGVNDRYLLFNLSALEKGEMFDEVRIFRTYVIDMEIMEQVSQPYWPGSCSILAPSPQTGQLSIWCHQIQEQEETQEFLVLEPDTSPWFAQQAPTPLIDDCIIMAICAWSSDGKLVAYVDTKDYPQSLYYIPVDNPLPVILEDTHTNIYGHPHWSLDSQFLYYSGECEDAGPCSVIMSVPNQEIIWRSNDQSNHVSANHVAWSSNNRYLAIPISTSGEQQILIFDVSTQQEISQVSKMGDIVLDMIWVDY